MEAVSLPSQIEQVAYEKLQAVKDLPPDKRAFVLAFADYAPIGAAARRAGVTRQEALEFLDDTDVQLALQMCRDPASRAIGVGLQWQLTKSKEIVDYGTELDIAYDKNGNEIGERMKDAFNAVKALELIGKLTGAIGTGGNTINLGTMNDKQKTDTFERLRDTLRARARAGEPLEAAFSRPVELPAELPDGLFE